MAPTLPTELVSQIVKTAGGDATQRNWATLSKLCLVDKSFLPFARDEIYSLVVLKYRQLVGHEKWQIGGEMVTFGGYEDESSGEEDEEASTINDQLLRTLRESPHVATLVRRVILHIQGQEHHEALMNHAAQGLVDLFTNCTEANSLVLHCSKSDVGLDLAASKLASAGLGTQLVDLSASMSGPGVLELLTKLPHLRRMVLNLHNYNYGAEGEETEKTLERLSFPFSLEVLCLPQEVAPP